MGGPENHDRKKTSISQKSENSTDQEKRHNNTEKMTDSASKTTVLTSPRKRRCTERQNLTDSPKRLEYDENSSSIEKRDKSYCSSIANAKFKPLITNPDDKNDFCGFNANIKGFLAFKCMQKPIF